MKKTITILFLFFGLTNVLQSQTKLDSLKALGRDSLIKLAVANIKNPEFNPANYDLITVKANKTSLIVEFELSIRLVTQKSCYYHSVTVALVGNGNSKSITGDCGNVKFYQPSDSTKKSIAFVLDAINKSDEIGDIQDKKLAEGTIMIIIENLTFYYVEVSSWSTYSHYKVDKLSGKISEAGHKQYDRSGEVPDEFVEIK